MISLLPPVGRHRKGYCYTLPAEIKEFGGNVFQAHVVHADVLRHLARTWSEEFPLAWLGEFTAP